MKRPFDIKSKTKHSLVHIGSLDSFDLTEGGTSAAASILKFFESKDANFLEVAIKAYDMLIPIENFGGEYTALRWICQLLRAPSKDNADSFLNEPTVASWYNFLAENDFERLKEYINYKYHFLSIPYDSEDGREIERRLRFLEDFILFANPDRERWELTSEILKELHIEEGLTIADVGCGAGYYTFKFADLVGLDGRIYGIEINPLHLDYLRKYVDEHDVGNVEIIESASDGIGLDSSVRVDVVFSCSLFHVLYAVFDDDNRKQFINSIVNVLRPDGALIVMDNDLVDEGDLPYHGPYIAKDLLISQLHYYGFDLLKTVQATRQRYALVFTKREDSELFASEDMTDIPNGIISAMSGVSLVKYALADAVPGMKYTEKGRAAARLFHHALQSMDENDLNATIEAYEAIITNERIGDEYTAFVWFCEYLKAKENVRAQMLSDPLANEYHDYLAADNYALLKLYLSMKYELAERGETGTDSDFEKAETGKGIDSMDDMLSVSEYITFNNPARERWEKTSLMLELIDVKPGQTIADVGCGSGYFTYKFSQLVGVSGKVYATELNKTALSYVEAMRDRYGLNIEPVISALNDVNLPPNRCDKIFMCSMYHAVYVSSIEFVKDAYIDSIKKALKDDGKLIIVDNEVKQEGVPEYHGSAIDRMLIISQLTHYGFVLVDEKQFIPQRYVLVFKKSDNRYK